MGCSICCFAFNSIEWIPAPQGICVAPTRSVSFNSIEWIHYVYEGLNRLAYHTFNSIEWIQENASRVYTNTNDYVQLSIPLNGFIWRPGGWRRCPRDLSIPLNGFRELGVSEDDMLIPSFNSIEWIPRGVREQLVSGVFLAFQFH